MPDIQNIPTTQYVGPRIIPHLWNPILWDASTQYDALAVVQYEGAGYVARYVPPQGTPPTNTEYWVRWADFNAQLAQLQQTVESFDNRITANAEGVAGARTAADAAQQSADDAQEAAAQLQQTVDSYDNRITANAEGVAGARTAADAAQEAAETAQEAATAARNGTINAVTAGLDPTGEIDNTPKLLELCAQGNVTIMFPAGLYRFSPCEITQDNIALVSATETFYPINRSGGREFLSSKVVESQNAVIFAPMSQQEYILKFNNTRNCTLSGIMFTGVGIRASYNDSYNDIDTLNCALLMYNMSMSRIFNCVFMGLLGSAIVCDNSWEVDITNAEFRFISMSDYSPQHRGVIEFKSTNQYINNSAINIANCNFEMFFCHAIYGYDASVRNCAISNMLVEINRLENWNFENRTYNAETPSSDITNALALFAAEDCSDFSFNVANIICDNFNYFTFVKGNVEYFHSAIAMTLGDSDMSLTIGTISFDILGQHSYWYIGPSTTTNVKKLNVGEFANNSGTAVRFGPKQGYLSEYSVPGNSIQQIPTIEWGAKVSNHSANMSYIERNVMYINFWFELSESLAVNDVIFTISDVAMPVSLIYWDVFPQLVDNYERGRCAFKNVDNGIAFVANATISNTIPVKSLHAVIPLTRH